MFCSYCKENIVGSQYKCQTCDNYSLCEECMSERMHPKHTMSLIRNPRQRRTRHPMERVITFSYDNIKFRTLLGNYAPYSNPNVRLPVCLLRLISRIHIPHTCMYH